VTTGGKGAAVLVDSNGQLGTVSSSRRLKYDIQNMGEASGDLLKLRPVTFRYKQAQDDGSHPLQYGLIAEEVADVYPGLVQWNRACSARGTRPPITTVGQWGHVCLASDGHSIFCIAGGLGICQARKCFLGA
jgi:hypothetical protein